jgi:hypothetical protein
LNASCSFQKLKLTAAHGPASYKTALVLNIKDIKAAAFIQANID